MIDITKVKVGDKVHYIPFKGCDESQVENGIVKKFSSSHNDCVFVVHHCAGDWANFMNYTAVLTKIKDLKLGWVNQEERNSE